MMKNDIETIIFDWIDQWVIGENFCPFARPVRLKQAIHISLSSANTIESMLTALEKECVDLQNQQTRSTTLLAFTTGAKDFYTYLDWLGAANKLIEVSGWEGIFQLASFHPDYMFADEPANSPTHYTNRAPLPIMHIIREAEISQVMPSQKEADLIVSRNKLRCESIGTNQLNDQLRDWQARLAQASK